MLNTGIQCSCILELLPAIAIAINNAIAIAIAINATTLHSMQGQLGEGKGRGTHKTSHVFQCRCKTGKGFLKVDYLGVGLVLLDCKSTVPAAHTAQTQKLKPIFGNDLGAVFTDSTRAFLTGA